MHLRKTNLGGQRLAPLPSLRDRNWWRKRVATRTQDAGGLPSRVRVEMAFLTISVASACWAVEAVRATTAATAYGGLRNHRARLAYSGLISVSGPVCEVIAPSRPRGSAHNRQAMVSGSRERAAAAKAYTARRVR